MSLYCNKRIFELLKNKKFAFRLFFLYLHIRTVLTKTRQKKYNQSIIKNRKPCRALYTDHSQSRLGHRDHRFALRTKTYRYLQSQRTPHTQRRNGRTFVRIISIITGIRHIYCRHTFRWRYDYTQIGCIAQQTIALTPQFRLSSLLKPINGRQAEPMPSLPSHST